MVRMAKKYFIGILINRNVYHRLIFFTGRQTQPDYYFRIIPYWNSFVRLFF